jgi:WhiB family redox-sensing transcriptional regulator
MPERWMTDASCAQMDGELWFPEPDWKPAAMALKVCADCPVRVRCLEFALVNRIEDGIYGGVPAATRIKLRRRREAVA